MNIIEALQHIKKNPGVAVELKVPDTRVYMYSDEQGNITLEDGPFSYEISLTTEEMLADWRVRYDG